MKEEMQEVRVRFTVEYETIVTIPKNDDRDARREAMLEAVENINIPDDEVLIYVPDSFALVAFTDVRTDRSVCGDLKLTT